MFTVNCEGEGLSDDGQCWTSRSELSRSDGSVGNGGFTKNRCYDYFNNQGCDWARGDCCDSYDQSFYVDTSTCTNCLCLDPDKTSIRGTYIH